MKATELVGKLAIRTAPVVSNNDYSFMNSPLKIIKVTDFHIVYEYPEENSMSKIFADKNPYILHAEWLDDNWTDYSKLISEPDFVASPDKGFQRMESTGIVLGGYDEFGRIVLPKELRCTMKISKKDSLEIYVDGDCVVLKKYIRGCALCGSLDCVADVNGKKVCRKCAERIAEATK
jgi:transcriptional pleiotropic regulator of transition state genes